MGLRYGTLSPYTIIVAAATCTVSARADTDDEIRLLFGQFVAAQNAHDIAAVRDILHDSPQFLWITRGVQYWGREAALQRFEEYYRGTWTLEPRIDQIRITELAPGVAQLVAPTIFRIAPPGEVAQPSLFVLNHIYLKTAAGWKLASIFPVPVPPTP